MSVLRFKLIFFSPRQNTRQILDHLFKTLPQNVGKINNYQECAFVTRGTGQFKPGHEAQPTIGTAEMLEYVEEDRVEVVVNDKGDREDVKRAIQELKAVHPYEEVAYDVYKLEDL
ncbi:GTP cyclohydrolase 1 type 2/Nif3 [Collybia nuda]|uniref:ATP phosphoribosyltransferase n=1 Tax=Collybia nuda TaxID=64659 RepID=A0A9P5Y896_9AGAR|nr:GTP cyclohydrolase 1 type 2/Nif3 [Collybia nuda]